MQIITGKTGVEHVTAADDRALHAATFGTGNYVLDVGSKFEAKVETSNNIVISDGELMMNGTHARIRYGETETVVIENGTTGYNRIDLIVARYKKQSGLESVELAVIKGETTSGTPEAPSCTEGNILEGAELAEMPLYAVKLEGVNIVSITQLFDISTGLSNIYRKNSIRKMTVIIPKSAVLSDGYGSVYTNMPDGFTPSNTILLCVKHYPDTFDSGVPSSLSGKRYYLNDYLGYCIDSNDANTGLEVEFNEQKDEDFNLYIGVKGANICGHYVELYFMKI